MTKYLRSFSGLDFRLQRDFMAASMPTDALTGLVDMMKKGVIEFKVSKISADSFSSEMIIHKAENQSGAMSSMALGSLPRCASALAAFWAWFAVNGAMCGAFAPMPPLAFSCAVGFAIGGAIIDFNMSC